MCLTGLSESGHGGRFEPCEEYKRLQAENAELRQENQLLRAENANLSMAHGPGNHTDWMLTRASKYEQLHKDLETLRQERDRMATALEKAVDDYGKPGGPWNVPSEPGTGLRMAKDALGGGVMTEDKKESLYWRARREEQKTENARLRAALSPILRHADAHDFAPPLKFSVADCRKIKQYIEQQRMPT